MSNLSDTSLTIPSVATIDFTDSRAVEGYGALLVNTFNAEGGFCYPSRRTRTTSRLQDFGREWLRKVEAALNLMTAEDVQRCLTWYDFVHRLTFNRPANEKFIDKWQTNVMLRMAKGEKADRLRLMYWVKSRLDRNPLAVPDNQRGWYCSVLDRWVKDASGPTPFSDYSPSEATAIAKFLHSTDLYAWTGREGKLNLLSN